MIKSESDDQLTIRQRQLSPVLVATSRGATYYTQWHVFKFAYSFSFKIQVEAGPLYFSSVVQVALQAHHCQLRGVFKYKQRYYGCLFSWWCSWQYWSKYSGQNILETVSYHATCPFFYYISYSTQSIYYFISIKWLQNAKIIVVDHNSLWDIIVMGLCYLVKAVKHKYWFHSPYEIKLIFRHCLISYTIMSHKEFKWMSSSDPPSPSYSERPTRDGNANPRRRDDQNHKVSFQDQSAIKFALIGPGYCSSVASSKPAGQQDSMLWPTLWPLELNPNSMKLKSTIRIFTGTQPLHCQCWCHQARQYGYSLRHSLFYSTWQSLISDIFSYQVPGSASIWSACSTNISDQRHWTKFFEYPALIWSAGMSPFLVSSIFFRVPCVDLIRSLSHYF